MTSINFLSDLRILSRKHWCSSSHNCKKKFSGNLQELALTRTPFQVVKKMEMRCIRKKNISRFDYKIKLHNGIGGLMFQTGACLKIVY